MPKERFPDNTENGSGFEKKEELGTPEYVEKQLEASLGEFGAAHKEFLKAAEISNNNQKPTILEKITKQYQKIEDALDAALPTLYNVTAFGIVFTNAHLYEAIQRSTEVPPDLSHVENIAAISTLTPLLLAVAIKASKSVLGKHTNTTSHE